MNELKPCPFCGGVDIHWDEEAHAMYCLDCNCEGPEAQVGTEDSALAAWNARASSPGPASAQSIQRYSMETTKRGLRCVLYCKDDSGDYVKYSDHIQARPDPAREALVGALKDCMEYIEQACEGFYPDCILKAERALAEQGHKGA